MVNYMLLFNSMPTQIGELCQSAMAENRRIDNEKQHTQLHN